MRKKPIKMHEPLVSIITPTFNSEAFISETIESVQSQTHSNWEHIIVDDGSTDGTIHLLKAYGEKDNRIRVFLMERNSGAAFCRNYATEKAKGDYIAFLDSDDLWEPKKLELQLNFMLERDCGISYTNYLKIDEEGEKLGIRIIAKPALTYKEQLYNNYVGNLTGMYSVKKLGKIIAPNIRKRQDWAVWLEAIKREEKPGKGLNLDLAYYRVHKKSMSHSKGKLLRHNFRFYRKYMKYSWVHSVFALFRFIWTYFVERPRYIERY